jgi:magnesium-transporting ATPase (P-type)
MMKSQDADERRTYYWFAAILAGFTLIVAFLVRWWRRLRLKRALDRRLPPPIVPEHIQGLTEVEAETRRQEGQDNAVSLIPRRTRREIIRENTFSIFNLSLLGIAFVQLLLDLPLDALLSLGVMVLNIGMNVFQELFAKRRVQDIELSNQPKATVVRDGKVRSIDPNDIVLGDALVIGPGDQLFVDGELMGEGQVIIDESTITGVGDHLTKSVGDKVYAGSFCVSGRAAFQTQKVGGDRKIATLISSIQSSKEELTPIELVINRVLKVLLLVVAVFTILLLSANFRLDLNIPTDEIINVANVIFSIAPAGLFFMIFLTYAAGTADLAKLGALVHRARSVESLAQVNVMCFTGEGVLTGTQAEVEAIQPQGDEEGMAVSRIRRILGDFARSTSMVNLLTRMFSNSFEGIGRVPVEEAPFMSVFGWSALTLDDDDMRGTYVLGVPEVLEHHLASADGDIIEPDEDEEKPTAVRKMFNRVGRVFRRSDEMSEGNNDEANKPDEPDQNADTEPEDPQTSDETDISDEGEGKPNLFRRLVGRVGGVFQRDSEEEGEVEEQEKVEAPQTQLLFAHSPEIKSLHDVSGGPQLPDGLIPLCKVSYSTQVRPETVETIKNFSANDVKIKIFTAEPPEQTAALLRGAGLYEDNESSMRLISGPDLETLNPVQMGGAVNEKVIFGQITPVQAGQVVETLRQQGQFVAVLGNGTNDIPALRQANLTVALQSSSQAVRSVADIVLLEDSPAVLKRVLDKGQSIVTGLLDVLKLYLTQITYLLMLILALRVTAWGFPYTSKQSSIISVFTLAIPSLILSLWATPGKFHSVRLGRLLARFVFPTALTISIAAMVVYRYFLDVYGDIDYSQLGVTYTVVAAGLLLVVLLKPPVRALAGVAPLSGDWRFTGVVSFLLVAFLLLSGISLAEQFFDLTWLKGPEDYLVVGMVVGWWVVTMRIIWFAWSKKQNR